MLLLDNQNWPKSASWLDGCQRDLLAELSPTFTQLPAGPDLDSNWCRSSVRPGHQLRLRAGSGRRHRRANRRQAQVLQDGLDHFALDEEGQHRASAAALVAGEHVLAEDAREELP